MDWLDSLREQLGHVAELRERVTAIGAGWLDSLQQLDLLAELRELVAATGGVDANLLGALALYVLPLAWLLTYSWRFGTGLGVEAQVFSAPRSGAFSPWWLQRCVYSSSCWWRWSASSCSSAGSMAQDDATAAGRIRV